MRRVLSFLGNITVATAVFAQPASAPNATPAAPVPPPAAAPAAGAAAGPGANATPAAPANPTAPGTPGAPGAVPGAPGAPGRGAGRGGFGGFGAQNPPGPPIPIIEPIKVPAGPGSLELLLPAGATATIDGKEAGAQRVFDFKEFEPNGVRRVEVVAKLADGTEVKRSVDVQPLWQVRVPINLPPVDQPSTVLTDTAVAVLWASFSPNGKLVATAAENGYVVLWDLALGRPVRNFSANREGVNSVVFSPDGEQLLTASADRLAVLWNVSTGRLIRRFGGHTGPVTSAVFSADGKKILTGSGDKTAILWDAATGAQIRTFTGHTDEVVTVGLSPDGRFVATGSTDKNAIVWNVDTGEKVNSLRTFDTVSGVSFSPDSKTLAAANFSNNVNLWEAATGKVIATTRRVNLDLNGMAFTPDGRFFFTAGKDATAKLWDGNSRNQIREFTGHGADVQSVASSPDGRLLLTSSRDGTARIFDIATGVEVVSLASSQGGKNWAVVGPDGLFDGSEAGRRMIGYRFSSKLPGASVDQFFGQFYRPGLLADVLRGERPMATAQMGRHLPPVLKIVSPKARSTPEAAIVIEVEATDKGGGVSAPQIFNNGARLAVEPTAKREGDVVRYSFPVTLGAGSNQLRISAASADGSWEAIPAELELNCGARSERKGRLFVVAVGVGDYADPRLKTAPGAADAQALSGLLQRRSSALYDRVDVVSVLGKDATRERIRETVLDIAALSQPHDTMMLLVCGRGALLGERLYFAPQELRFSSAGREADFRQQGMDADELAGLLGSAKALNRVLVLDAVDVPAIAATDKARPAPFALRAAVERWSRAQGVYAMAACAAPGAQPNGVLAGLLLEAAGTSTAAAAPAPTARDAANAIGVMDWFNSALDRSGPVINRLGLDPQVLQASTKPKSFPLLAAAR